MTPHTPGFFYTMKRIFVLAITISLLFIQPNFAEDKNVQMQTSVAEAKELDPRALILKDYLAKYNSPLENQAQDFIDAADFNNIDWKLVPAIAGVESTFGKFIPGGFNGWGWGVYGNQALYFNSWRDGIFIVSKGLKENYINKGLKNPYEMNRAYATSPTWGRKVSYFLKDIEKFSKKYEALKIPEQKTAESSAKLAFKF